MGEISTKSGHIHLPQRCTPFPESPVEILNLPSSLLAILMARTVIQVIRRNDIAEHLQSVELSVANILGLTTHFINIYIYTASV